MGSSGAGKSTLLNCLTYRNLKGLNVSGLVCINGSQVTQSQLAAESAYVQQDDMFIGYLTVKEQLLFQVNRDISTFFTSSIWNDLSDGIDSDIRNFSVLGENGIRLHFEN